jgi:hypothetical protein
MSAPTIPCRCPGPCEARVEYEPEFEGDDGTNHCLYCPRCEEAGCDIGDFDPRSQKRQVIPCRADVQDEEDRQQAIEDARLDAEDACVPCPKCNGTAYPLGKLGRLTHYRCRDCGADSNSDGEYEA